MTVFESGAILLYLAEKYNALIPFMNPLVRVETIKWLFWGSTSVSTKFKIFGFYFKYCPHKMPYCLSRYTKECQRLLNVLEEHLASHGMHWVVGGTVCQANLTLSIIYYTSWLHNRGHCHLAMDTRAPSHLRQRF